MSGILSAVGFTRALAQDFIGLISPTRELSWTVTNADGTAAVDQNGQAITAGMVGFVTLAEDTRDELVITEHPVETGSVISDHAFALPVRLSMHLAWSPSDEMGSLGAIPLSGITQLFSSPVDAEHLQQIYYALVQLKANRSLCSIITPKRIYTSMLLALLTQHTDDETEHTIVVDAQFQEILFANTTTVSSQINVSAQSDPQSTSPVSAQGSKQLQSGNNFNPAVNELDT